MGFLDKAKQMAEQAQQKIDDVQKQRGERQAEDGGAGAGGVRYDEHGRPIADAPGPDEAASVPPVADAPRAPEEAASTPPVAEDGPHAPPEAAVAPPAPEEAATLSPPHADSAAPEPPTPAPGGANANPDPFKPIQ